MPLSSSSSSPPTTMFLSPCVSALPFHPILTLSKVKRKNDNTVLKYGSSLHLFFGFVCKPLSSRGSKSHGMSPIWSDLLHSLSTSLMTRESSSPLPSATTTLQKFLNWSVLLFLFLLSLSLIPCLKAPLSLLWHRHDGRHAWLLQIYPAPFRPGSHGSQGSFRRQARRHPHPQQTSHRWSQAPLHHSQSYGPYVLFHRSTLFLHCLSSTAAQGPSSDPASIAEAEKRAGAKKEDWFVC